jgi:hypothetical protein
MGLLHVVGPYLIIGFVVYSVYVVPSIFMAIFYYKIGREPLWLYFVLSLLLTPIITLIAFRFVTPKFAVLEQRTIKKAWQKLCPFCAEPIAFAAVYCKHCRQDVL